MINIKFEEEEIIDIIDKKIENWYLDEKTSERVRKNLLDKLNKGELEGIELYMIDRMIDKMRYEK